MGTLEHILDWTRSPERLYVAWLAVYGLALALALFGVWCLVTRHRVGKATAAVWALVSLGPAAFCFCDACSRWDATSAAPAALAVKASLVAAVLAGAYGFGVLQRRAGGGAAPSRVRLSWLLVLGNGAAAAWAGGCFHQAVAPVPYQDLPTPSSTKWAVVPGAEGFTDRGQAISLLGPEDPLDFQPLAMSRQFGGRFRERLIELEPPDNRANCHGWVFTGGAFAVGGTDAAAILSDNGYERVQQPRPGDLVIYRDIDGSVNHSGIVRLAEADVVLVESKWGAQARYLHRLLDQVYSSVYEFHRSRRQGHLLNLGPEQGSAMP